LEFTLILTGVACIIGAIIGGGVKLVQIELSPVASLWRQALLGLFGLILVISGLIAGGHLLTLGTQEKSATQSAGSGSSQPSSDQQQQTSNGGAPVAEKPKTPAAEASSLSANESSSTQPQAETSFPTRSPSSLPSKVDIFWCATDDGGAMNENTAMQIVSGLRATNQIARLRVRLLPQATNAKPDYRIFRNIVRYDPGELSAAEEIARLATQSSGATFEPAPALPGSPSIDYLSVFVCAPR
jgi:hypothetical protein